MQAKDKFLAFDAEADRKKKSRRRTPADRISGRIFDETHAPIQELRADQRPQDPNLDGTGLRFDTMEHSGEYPDTMPQAIKLIDAEGRSCVYVPISLRTAWWSTARGLCSLRRMNDRQSSKVPDVSTNVEIGESPEPPPREGVQ